MDKFSAQPVRVRFARIRQWLAKPFIEEVARSSYRKAKIALENERNKIWNRTRRVEEIQPVPLLPAPTLISGIAGGPHWDGAPGTWISMYTHHEPKPAHLTPEPYSPLATLPPERFQNTGEFLLDKRDTLFADVPMVVAIDPDEEQTVAHPEPALYRIQQMARAKQKGEDSTCA